MKPHHYLAVFIRLFAIALFVFTAHQYGYLLQSIVSGEIEKLDNSVITFQIILYVFLPLLISAALWFFPVIAAKTILKSEIDQNIEPMNKVSIFVVAIAVLGLYITYDALADAIYYISLWLLSHSSSDIATTTASFFLQTQ